MTEERKIKKKSSKLSYVMSIVGVVLGIGMAVAVIYYREWFESFGKYGYIGGFAISVLGGSVWIVPVPMAAVIFAMGSVVKFPWLLAIANGLGETVGAVIIYMTGHGAGTAVLNKSAEGGKINAAYNRLMGLVQRKGSITLFLLAAILNPFFYPAALAAGALRFGMRKYFFICFVGKTIKGMTIVYAGYWGIKGIFRAIGVDL